MSNEQKISLLKLNDTKRYIAYIKEELAKNSKMVDYTNFIPFVYDDELLKEMCNNEGIDMTYSSSYYVEGKYNPYMPLDKLVFTRKKAR